jgi:hypothetical protein
VHAPLEGLSDITQVLSVAGEVITLVWREREMYNKSVQ